MLTSENSPSRDFIARLEDTLDAGFRKDKQIFFEIRLIATHQLYRKSDLE